MIYHCIHHVKFYNVFNWNEDILSHIYEDCLMTTTCFKQTQRTDLRYLTSITCSVINKYLSRLRHGMHTQIHT